MYCPRFKREVIPEQYQCRSQSSQYPPVPPLALAVEQEIHERLPSAGHCVSSIFEAIASVEVDCDESNGKAIFLGPMPARRANTANCHPASERCDYAATL